MTQVPDDEKFLKRQGNLMKILQWPLRETARLVAKIVIRVLKRNQRIANLLLKIDFRPLNAAPIRLGAEILQGIRATGNTRGEFGVNIAGYITAESGVGEGARANIRAVERTGIPFVLNNISSPSRKGDATFADLVREDHPFVFNLVHANPDNFRPLLHDRGIDYFINKYTVGFWYWELSNVPEEWFYCFRYLNEVWVPSSFCQEAILKVSPVPVVKIPPPVVVEKIRDADREYFGLMEEAFIFFFMFDFLSQFERKNPLAVLKAFRIAFSLTDNVQLVVKYSNSEQDRAARDRLIEGARGLNVKVIDGYLGRDEINALTSLSDCYVSLHRSEGFGLPLAEAMYLKKPVIATAYSSNMDFMNANNSFLVRYKLVEIRNNYGPYKKGNVWAEADIEHAAQLMRLVYEDRDLARHIGENASVDIRRDLSPEATGKKISSRLEQIVKEKQLDISLTR